MSGPALGLGAALTRRLVYHFLPRDEGGTGMISRRRFIHMSATALLPAIVVAGTVNVPIQVSAQVQSSAPSDRAIGQNISKALIKAGIDPRTTSVQVITTSTHVVYLSGLISDPQTIKL